jgi:hypothetical protein
VTPLCGKEEAPLPKTELEDRDFSDAANTGGPWAYCLDKRNQIIALGPTGSPATQILSDNLQDRRLT